jgi:hypothetical protein
MPLTLFRSAPAIGLAAWLFLAPAQAMAADVDASASYVVSLGGINIANVSIDLTDNGSRYSMDLSANVAGLGSLIASGSATASASGRSSSPQLTSEEFDLATHANGENFTVDISYQGRNVTAFRVDPPLVDIDRVPIERSHLRDVSDMLSSFVFKGGALDKNLCQRKMQIFTGVERFNIAMSFVADDEATSPRTGYQGPVMLCNIRYTPISGHFTTSEMTTFLAESDRILAWYAPLGETGYFIPYRMLVTTTMGDLSMVLTQMRF